MKNKKEYLKVITAAMALTMIVSSVSLPVSAKENYDHSHLTISMRNPADQSMSDSLSWIYSNTRTPDIGTFGGEWSVLALKKGEYPVNRNYFNGYYQRVSDTLKKNNGILEGDRKYTEYARVSIALSAIGKDPANVEGYNLLEKLTSYEKVKRQGINGPIFALIAMDSCNYEPADSSIRQKYVDYILNQEISGGGFSLRGPKSEPDIDITAMAIQGLTPYQNDNRVKDAINRAIDVLSKMQQSDGGMCSWGTSNSESVSQTIIALCGLKIDPDTDLRFVKNGHSLIDALLTFECSGGGFFHVQPSKGSSSKPNSMATDQAALALVSYQRMRCNEPHIYRTEPVSVQEKPVIQYRSADQSGIWKKYADGVWNFEKSGKAVSGWQKIDGYWYYFSSEKAMQTGWKKLNDTWYCFSDGGIMRTGWQKVSGTWYYFKDWGGMVTGWQKINGRWYHFKDWGGMTTGWQKINGCWYYMTESGAMLANTTTPDGYQVDSSGKML